MSDERKAALLAVVNNYNDAQEDESMHLDAFDILNGLMECGDDEVATVIAELNRKTEELEE